jgi:hypothetical protein
MNLLHHQLQRQQYKQVLHSWMQQLCITAERQHGHGTQYGLSNQLHSLAVSKTSCLPIHSTYV